MAGVYRYEKLGREAHELENFRVSSRVRRAEKSQGASMDSVKDAWMLSKASMHFGILMGPKTTFGPF